MVEVELESKVEKVQVAPAPWALDKLPPFPAVATRLMQVLAKEDANINEVGRIIAAEPVFATRVLQMANSPLFALQRQVKTIAHAITLLGFQRIKSVTMTRAMGDFVGPALKIEPLRKCWQNSLAGALLAERLARCCQMDADVAYLAALLRDIGRLALLVRWPGPYANLLATVAADSFDMMATERDLFDIDHCEAGAWVLAHMQFPEVLCQVAARHHEIPAGPFGIIQLVRVADLMADSLGFGVLAGIPGPEWIEVLAQLPEPARSHFQHQPEELRAETLSKIQSWK
jgi:putative nucleotidyltransferase with HDIG domain